MTHSGMRIRFTLRLKPYRRNTYTRLEWYLNFAANSLLPKPLEKCLWTWVPAIVLHCTQLQGVPPHTAHRTTLGPINSYDFSQLSCSRRFGTLRESMSSLLRHIVSWITCNPNVSRNVQPRLSWNNSFWWIGWHNKETSHFAVLVYHSKMVNSALYDNGMLTEDMLVCTQMQSFEF